MRCLIVLLALLVAAPALAAEVENFRLLDAEGISHELYGLRDSTKAIVIMAHGLGCPIVDQSLAALNALAADFGKKGVSFYLLNPNPGDSPEAIAAHLREFKNQIPALVDPSQVVARSLKLKRTAEVVVIDPDTWNIVFRGPMDDGTRDYGAVRDKSANNYLKDALTALLAGHKERIPHAPEAKGCALNLDQEPAPSYAKIIAPILLKRCFSCHDGDGNAEWTMSGYAAVKQWAPMIRETIMTRRMPPWWVEPDASHFRRPIMLSLDEQKRLLAWLEAGAPRDPSGADPLTVAIKKHHPAPERILSLSQPIDVPANGEMEYKYARLLVADQDMYIHGVSMLTQKSSLHHAVLLAAPAGPTGEPALAGPELMHGKDCILMGGVRVRVPPEYVYKLPKGYALYLEMHFRTLGHPVHFDPKFALHTVKPGEKVRVLNQENVGNDDIHISAGDPEAKMTAESKAYQGPVQIVALAPHMHLRGKYMKISALYPDGHRELLVSVPNYNVHWETYYWFKKPVNLPAGAKLALSGAFDNSKQNPFNPDPTKALTWDQQFSGEMFLVTVSYADPPITPVQNIAQH